MFYEVNAVAGASPSKYWALLSFTDRRGALHEKQIRKERQATKNSNILQAVTDALEVLQGRCRVNVWTDSEYLVEAFRQGWVTNWQQNGWESAKGKTVKNAYQWQVLCSLVERHQVTFHYTREGRP
ncbi:MAG: ribonuclease HI [Lachnospiraceae bacterium]|jgi:ribonuclease HI|nr:ribonuclease HI [Lachnospiraceae bacterium]